MNNFKKIITISIVWAVLFIPTHKTHAQSRQSAAFVYGYYPNEGQQELFDEGYRRHLEWHRQHNDPLPWYGWYVTSGDRIGLFIDGSFGIPFSAFDRRVDIAEDGADAAQNVSPFSKPAFRRTYILRRDLSTGSPLEDRNPSSSIQVLFYKLRPGKATAFENVLQKLRSALETAADAPVHTWYQLVIGGAHPTYMLMIPREDWTSYGTYHETIASAIARFFDSEEEANMLSALAQSVEHIRSEKWSYRSDLSNIPDK